MVLLQSLAGLSSYPHKLYIHKFFPMANLNVLPSVLGLTACFTPMLNIR